MNRTIEAKLLRVALVAGGLYAVLLLVAGGGDLLGVPEQLGAVLPFLCVALVTAVLVRIRTPLDRLVERLTRYREVTPYAALADAAQRLQAGSLTEALPRLARVLADGTGATRATVWLVVDERLVEAASHPLAGERQETAESLAVLLARPGTCHAVPVLDGPTLRAVLAIDKPNRPITPADQGLIRDVANGAGLLLRGVALNAELAERVRRADQLAAELQASRQRLVQARDVERRRLLTELSRATSGRLAALRTQIATARADLDGRQHAGGEAREAPQALAAARAELDELIDRFRVIARGVYPAVLRGQGPGAALEELAADLPRPVRLSLALDARLAWEIESGIYHVAAAVLNLLAGAPAPAELRVELGTGNGRVQLLVEDPAPPMAAARLDAALTDDAERLVALGGDLEWGETAPVGPVQDTGPGLRLRAWLPDRLEPLLAATGSGQS